MLHKTPYRADLNVLEYVDKIRTSPQLGRASNTDYLITWRAKFPNLKGGEPGKYFNVHHAIEQQVYEVRWPNLFNELEISSLENLRGISGEINSGIHLKAIRKRWDEFYEEFPLGGGKIPTREQILEHAKKIDDEFGKYFSPPIRPLDY